MNTTRRTRFTRSHLFVFGGLGLMGCTLLLVQALLANLAAPDAAPGDWRTAGAFLTQGMAHILAGWDHLAFVLCLAIIARGRRLAWLVTCFTLGHSITLGLGFLVVVRVPAVPVETAIILSVLLMAWKAFAAIRSGQIVDSRFHAGLIFLFGLIHGMGFAHALSDYETPHGEALVSLAFFNLGIEIGQLLFVGGIAVITAPLRKAPPTLALAGRPPETGSGSI